MSYKVHIGNINILSYIFLRIFRFSFTKFLFESHIRHFWHNGTLFRAINFVFCFLLRGNYLRIYFDVTLYVNLIICRLLAFLMSFDFPLERKMYTRRTKQSVDNSKHPLFSTISVIQCNSIDTGLYTSQYYKLLSIFLVHLLRLG